MSLTSALNASEGFRIKLVTLVKLVNKPSMTGVPRLKGWQLLRRRHVILEKFLFDREARTAGVDTGCGGFTCDINVRRLPEKELRS